MENLNIIYLIKLEVILNYLVNYSILLGNYINNLDVSFTIYTSTLKRTSK